MFVIAADAKSLYTSLTSHHPVPVRLNEGLPVIMVLHKASCEQASQLKAQQISTATGYRTCEMMCN